MEKKCTKNSHNSTTLTCRIIMTNNWLHHKMCLLNDCVFFVYISPLPGSLHLIHTHTNFHHIFIQYYFHFPFQLILLNLLFVDILPCNRIVFNGKRWDCDMPPKTICSNTMIRLKSSFHFLFGAGFSPHTPHMVVDVVHFMFFFLFRSFSWILRSEIRFSRLIKIACEML